MPEQHLLDQQLLQVLESMNIPKAKVKEMLQQPNEKKWQLVWGQVSKHDTGTHTLRCFGVHVNFTLYFPPPPLPAVPGLDCSISIRFATALGTTSTTSLRTLKHGTAKEER